MTQRSPQNNFSTILLRIILLVAIFITISCTEQDVFEPQSYEELEGHTVTAMEGSIQQDMIIRDLKNLDINPLYFTNITDCMLAIRNGKADVFFGSDIQAYNEAFKEQHLKICCYLEDLVTPFAFGVKKGNTEILTKCNNFIDSLKATGELDEIYHRWFKPTTNGYHECIVIDPISPDPGTDEDVLRIGVAGVKDPAELLINNKWTGMEIELLQRFAAENGYALEILTFDFNNLIPALQSDRIDIAAATLIINKERKEKIDFITPHASMRGVFIVADHTQNDASVWTKIKRSFKASLIKENRWVLILEGLWRTIIITLFSLLGGSIIGGIICWMRMCKVRWLNKFAKGYVYFLRNIPILVLLMILFYVILAHSGLSAVNIAIIAFSIDSAAFISEIFRTGIQSVDKGQTEAGRGLGCSAFKAFRYIVAPQAAKISLPVYKNECVSLLKSTSVVGYISIIDLTKASDLIRSASFEAFFPLITITILYFVLASLLTWLIDICFNKK